MPMKTRVGFRIKLAFMYQISILKSIVLSVLQLSTPDSNRQSPWTEGSKGLCFGKCVHSWCCYKPTSITTHLCLSTHNSLLQLLFVLEITFLQMLFISSRTALRILNVSLRTRSITFSIPLVEAYAVSHWCFLDGFWIHNGSEGYFWNYLLEEFFEFDFFPNFKRTKRDRRFCFPWSQSSAYTGRSLIFSKFFFSGTGHS